MVSGRGLGHTGGTLDKLESIPGFRTGLSEEEFGRALERTGVAFGGQTADLVPADRKLYALRDVTGLIESVPLIASSILSKKLAEGIDALILDVKFGTGAFLPDPERGGVLARTMVDLAGRLGLPAVAFQTAMDRPLGRAMGHTLEIAESLACLRGDGPADLRELVGLFGGAMLEKSDPSLAEGEGTARILAALDDGSALEVFARVIAEQGGDPACCESTDALPAAPDVVPFEADRDGVLSYTDVRELGLAVAELGGGRLRLEDEIEPTVGLVALGEHGARVAKGDTLFEIHHRGGRGLEAARARIARAIDLAGEPTTSPLVLGRID